MSRNTYREFLGTRSARSIVLWFDLYEAEKMKPYLERGPVIFNPNDVTVESLPTVFVYNADTQRPGVVYGGVLAGKALSEDGVELGRWACSSENFIIMDLGVCNPKDSHHEAYTKHYPKGYRMEFVSWGDVEKHSRLNTAIKLKNSLLRKLTSRPQPRPRLEVGFDDGSGSVLHHDHILSV